MDNLNLSDDNKHQQTKKLLRLLPVLISVLLAALMVAAAELLNEKEIIFPEITAIAVGALAAPVQSWNTSRLRLLGCISVSALCGVITVRYLPLPTEVRIIAGLIMSLGIITLSKTGFVPAVSACILPILMNTESFVYVISVVVMTGLILLSQRLLERLGLRDKYHFRPVQPTKELLLLRLRQLLLLSAAAFLPAYYHEIFFIAPPLMVGFIEMSSPKSKLRSRAPLAVGLISAAAFMGALSRWAVTEAAGLPLFVSAALSVLMIILLISQCGLYFPPCGAIATLPFIIPENALLRFPFEVTAGFAVLTAAALLLFKDKNAHKDT